MQPAQPTPLAELVKSLAGLHQAQHQALMDMKLEQEESLPAFSPGAGWRPAGHPELARPGGNSRRSPIDSPHPADEDGTPRRPGGLCGPFWKNSGGVWLGAQPVAGCAWSPCWRGKRRVAAQHLPVANLLAYDDLKRAILQCFGRTPEQHRQRFRSVELGDCGRRPFVMASAAPGRVPQVALGRARDVEGELSTWWCWSSSSPDYPGERLEWVQCHRPTSLAQAIQLAEDHLAACPGVGEPRPTLSLSLSPPSLSSPSLSRPVPAPRSRLPVAPRAPPRSGNGQTDHYPRRGGGGQSPLPLHRTLSGNPLPTLLPLGRR